MISRAFERAASLVYSMPRRHNRSVIFTITIFVAEMKRLLAFLLLLLYVNSYTEFQEALRVPILVAHFIEHRQQVKDMTFSQFLAMHYQTSANHDDRDDQLPFKEMHHSGVVPAMALPDQRMVLEATAPLSDVTHCSAYHEVSISSPYSKIFQPPRVS